MNNPYKFTQEDVIFNIFAMRNNISPNEMKPEREKYFSKGQTCLRSSFPGKSYRWGIHCDNHGKVALYAVDSPERIHMKTNPELRHIKAMRIKSSK